MHDGGVVVRSANGRVRCVGGSESAVQGLIANYDVIAPVHPLVFVPQTDSVPDFVDRARQEASVGPAEPDRLGPADATEFRHADAGEELLG